MIFFNKNTFTYSYKKKNDLGFNNIYKLPKLNFKKINKYLRIRE